MIDYGSNVSAPYVMPDPARPGHYVSEMRDGVVIGFQNYAAAKRGWGWRGHMLVRFADGKTVWTPVSKK